MLNSAYFPTGKTIAMNITTTSTATPVQAFSTPGESLTHAYRVCNAGSGSVFLAYANVQGAAIATIPVDGTPGTGVYLQAGSIAVFALPHDCYFAAITPSGTSTLYITPGVFV